MLGAVGLAGLAGALFSPIAGRLSGIYLGLASIGLVFIGQHILFNATGVTGGFNGRDAAPFSLFGFSFSDSDPEDFSVLGVPYGALERLWYLGLVLVALAWWYARNLVRSRPGRAMQQVRDSEVAAAVMGVNVPVHKAAAFTVSSMYAGLGGVFLALAFGRIVPESFGFLVSIDFLVMIVIGGLGSIGGAIAGAVLISALPQVLNHYSGSLPLVAEAGSGGLQATQAARLLYGAAVVAVLIYAPHGLAGATRRFGHRRATARTPVQPKESTA
jgi:branched-chain amino acid transport system permease protein